MVVIIMLNKRFSTIIMTETKKIIYNEINSGVV